MVKRTGTSLSFAVLLLFLPQITLAQHMYLDANGDGINTVEDRLDETSPTTVDIWLNTDHQRDGSTAACPTGEAMTLNSYDFIIHADGGTVAWAGFSNGQPTMAVSFGEAADSTDYHNGRGGGTILDPGLYKLASITVTVVSGLPRLSIAPSTGLAAIFATSFGSRCSGLDNDNTLKLGADWNDSDGVGPPDQPPTIVAPSSLAANVGSDVSLEVDAVDSLAQNAPVISATGYPPGLTLSVSAIGTNASRGTLSGHLGTNDAGIHSVVWKATGQTGLSSTTTTTMDVSSQSQVSGASIVGYTTAGNYVIASEGENGINARIGKWGSVWPWGFCESNVGYPCTGISNTLAVEVDVTTGGFLTFDYEFMQYGTPFLSDDLQITVSDTQGGPVQTVAWNYGNPEACWGSLWQSPKKTVKVDLSQWPNRHVFLRIWVRDCLGNQTDAMAIVNSIAIRDCYVTPLAPLSAEDQAIFEDNPNTPVESLLIDSMKVAVACIKQAVQSAGGTFKVKSAYRTQSYQSHLWELYDKWDRIKNDPTASDLCQEFLTQLNDHIHYHEMDSLETHPAFKAGYHTLGRAIDASWGGITNAQVDALACLCNLYRPLKKKDKPHFILRPCP